MAKSLRSKFKRKMRSIARTKKAPKEQARLDGAVARRAVHEQAEAEKEAQAAATAAAAAAAEPQAEEMDLCEKKPATINVKTMKKADGNFPSWANNRLKKKMSKLHKAAKKNKAAKAKQRR